MLELNRDVFAGEEILVSYEYSTLDPELFVSTRKWLEEQGDIDVTVEKEEEDSQAVSETVVDLIDTPAAEPAVLDSVATPAVSETEATDTAAAVDNNVTLYSNTPRVAPTQECGECGGQVEKGHRCDKCKSWMHVFCGYDFGDEEGKKELRRCKKHGTPNSDSPKVAEVKKKVPSTSQKSTPQSLTTRETRGAKLQSIAAATAAPKKSPAAPKRKSVPLSAAGINNEENIKKQRIIKQIELYDETIISSGEGGESDESEESD